MLDSSKAGRGGGGGLGRERPGQQRPLPPSLLTLPPSLPAPPTQVLSALFIKGDFVHGLCTVPIPSGSLSPESLLLAKLLLIHHSASPCQFLPEVFPALPSSNPLNLPANLGSQNVLSKYLLNETNT